MHLNMVFVAVLLFIAMLLSGCQSLSTENRSSETQESAIQESEISVHTVITDITDSLQRSRLSTTSESDPQDSGAEVSINCPLPDDVRGIIDQINQFYKFTSSEDKPRLLFSEQLLESFEYPGKYEKLEKRLDYISEKMKDCIVGFEISPPSSHRHIFDESYRAIYPEGEQILENTEKSDSSRILVLFPKISYISLKEIRIRYTLVEYPNNKVNRIQGELSLPKPTFDCKEMEKHIGKYGMRILNNSNMADMTEIKRIEKRIKSTVDENCKAGITFQEIKKCIASVRLEEEFAGRIPWNMIPQPENPTHRIISHAESVCYDDGLI